MVNRASIRQQIMKPKNKKKKKKRKKTKCQDHIQYYKDLQNLKRYGKPTGQGFGAARKGPQVHGGPIEAVTDEKYSEGESFSTNLNEVPNIGVK